MSDLAVERDGLAARVAELEADKVGLEEAVEAAEAENEEVHHQVRLFRRPLVCVWRAVADVVGDYESACWLLVVCLFQESSFVLCFLRGVCLPVPDASVSFILSHLSPLPTLPF